MDPFQSPFMPHGHCYFWTPDILWLHVGSDALIALAYYSIPLALIYFVLKRKRLDFDWLFLLFGLFIFACGTTHVMGIVTTWIPLYRIEGWLKLFTAVVSLFTAALLWPTMPRLLALPSPTELKLINESLKREILERQEAQSALKVLNRDLEERVQERTQALESSNQRLQAEIRKHVQTQSKLHEQSQRLEQSNRELEQFAYAVSHDLRAPLRGIRNFSELLQEKCTDLDADAQRYLEHIQNSTEQMNLLILDLLEYARASKNPPQKQVKDLNELLQEVLDSLSPEIEKKQAQIESAELPQVEVYPQHIQQVFQNLLSNALKFNQAESLTIKIQAQKEPDHWLFSVRDNGIGFQEQDQERIFQIFQRLHGQSEYPGTGIGLATCKKVIEAHHGQIWAKSSPGQGSTFYFTLPSTSTPSKVLAH